MKTCTGCAETKPLDQFVKDKRSKDGRQARCKACTNAAGRGNYQRDLEANRAKKRAYRDANAEVTRAQARERVRRWRERNPDLARERSTATSRTFRERNPDYHRAWYQSNIEKERERLRDSMRRWREANPELELERKRRYRAANIDVVRKREREKTYARRAMTSSSPELADYMAELVLKPCVYCGATERISIDHVIPLSRGGKHEAANLAPACLSCNCSKGARLPDEWAYGEPVVP